MRLPVNKVARETFLRSYALALLTHPNADALTGIEGVTDEASASFFVTPDLRSGFVVTEKGDGRHLFSLVKGRGHDLVDAAIERGVNTLDCFEGYLSDLYFEHGFTIYRREANYTPGEPDVVWMSRDYRCAHCGIPYGH